VEQLVAVSRRLPPWVRNPHSKPEAVHGLKTKFRRLGLNTVCESARCPNLNECFHNGTATFLILGDDCTRRCGFCAVPHRSGAGETRPVEPEEPENVAAMAAELKLRHAVITSVTRDDLADGGAAHFARTVHCVRAALPETGIEVLTPDFQGNEDALARVIEARPDVFNHNLETVPRLYPEVRPQADYQRSLRVLEFAARHSRGAQTKSGLMVGLGETPAEVTKVLRDLLEAGVEVVTIGQYLQPTLRNLPVAEYVVPAQFDAYREYGLEIGFRAVLSGPLVRSSYLAEQTHKSSRQARC